LLSGLFAKFENLCWTVLHLCLAKKLVHERRKRPTKWLVRQIREFVLDCSTPVTGEKLVRERRKRPTKDDASERNDPASSVEASFVLSPNGQPLGHGQRNSNRLCTLSHLPIIELALKSWWEREDIRLIDQHTIWK